MSCIEICLDNQMVIIFFKNCSEISYFRVSELYYLNQQEPIVSLRQVHVIKTLDAIECNQCQTTQLILLLFADHGNSESIFETKIYILF